MAVNGKRVDAKVRLGKWEKDVLCGLAMAPDNIKTLESEDDLKLDKFAAKLSLDDRKRLEAGKVVPTFYICYCWGDYSFFGGKSEEELEDMEGSEIPWPSRAVKSRTLKTLQDKKLIIAENLGLKGCRKFYSLTAEGKKTAEKLTS